MLPKTQFLDSKNVQCNFEMHNLNMEHTHVHATMEHTHALEITRDY